MVTPPSKRRWDDAHVLRVAVSLNRDSEADLVERVEREPNRSAYIKCLIRADVEREGRDAREGAE